MLSYDPDYGQLKLLKNASTETQSFQVTEGVFSTIESAFETGESQKIFDTLARLNDDSSKKTRYIKEIQSYIHENNAYSEARSIFCSSEVRALDT